MDLLEGRLLHVSLEKLIEMYDAKHRFTVKEICNIHQLWLGDLYSWAGKYRQVNMCKDAFPFAAAYLIPNLMMTFEKNCLDQFTPCSFDTLDETINALAITHTELVLIHPFREGNGRLSRILSSLMALQAGLPLLTFAGITGKAKQNYFLAVQAGLDKNYEPMKGFFKAIIKKTFKIYGKKI
jgi:cell filamentation protein